MLRIRVLCALALCAACGDSSTNFDDYALYRSAALAKTIEVVLPSGVVDAELGSVTRRFLASGERTVTFTHDVSASSSRSVPRIVVADCNTPGLTRVLERLDLQCGPDGSFSFLDKTYAGIDDVLVATLADPERDSLPMTLYFGVDATHALRYVRDLTPAWRPAFRCWRDGHIEREGRWSGRDAVRLSGASTQLQALARLPIERASDPGVDIVMHGTLDPSQVAAYRSTLRSVRSELIALLARRGPNDAESIDVDALPRLQVHLWPDAQALALVSGTWELSTVGPPANQVDVALTSRHDNGFAAARAFALALAGAPADDWLLDGISMHVARAWWGRNQVDWIPYLFIGGNVPEVATLVAQRTRVSQHIVTPMRGALFDCWLALHGQGALRDAWRGVNKLELPTTADLTASIERAHPEMEQLKLRRENADPARMRAVLHAAFRRGVQLVQAADADGRGFKGYGTLSCRDSVRDAMEAGANSFGLTAYAFVDDDLALWAGTPRSEPFATSTPDVALAAAAAQAGNVRVMFTPQMLTSRSGSWSGWSLNESLETWRDFFADWKACVVHYALLAELCEAETLCLGSELASATRADYDDAELPWVPKYSLASSERWREVIAAARSCFHGALTYAANSEGEARQLDFWDQLDFVSVDVFASLDDADPNATRPTDPQAVARMRGALHSLANVAREHGKPALVTEIGFAPTTENWRAPQRALGDVDLDAQRSMYACLADAIKLQNSTSAPLAGVFVWCWSTDPRAGNAPDRSFTPQNRPAAELLARVYGRK